MSNNFRSDALNLIGSYSDDSDSDSSVDIESIILAVKGSETNKPGVIDSVGTEQPDEQQPDEISVVIPAVITQDEVPQVGMDYTVDSDPPDESTYTQIQLLESQLDSGGENDIIDSSANTRADEHKLTKEPVKTNSTGEVLSQDQSDHTDHTIGTTVEILSDQNVQVEADEHQEILHSDIQNTHTPKGEQSGAEDGLSVTKSLQNDAGDDTNSLSIECVSTPSKVQATDQPDDHQNSNQLTSDAAVFDDKNYYQQFPVVSREESSSLHHGHHSGEYGYHQQYEQYDLQYQYEQYYNQHQYYEEHVQQHGKEQYASTAQHQQEIAHFQQQEEAGMSTQDQQQRYMQSDHHQCVHPDHLQYSQTEQQLTSMHTDQPQYLMPDQNQYLIPPNQQEHSMPKQHQYSQAEQQQYSQPDQQQYEQQRYSQPEQQQYSQPDHQQYSQPEQQQYSQPEQQQYSQPDHQQYSQPEQQQYSQPEQQQYSQPEQHQYLQPDQQQYSQPYSEQQQYSQSKQQQYSQPEQQQYSQPEQQPYSQPEQQQYSQPEQQQYSHPGQQQYSQPHQQQYSHPDQQQYSQPEQQHSYMQQYYTGPNQQQYSHPSQQDQQQHFAQPDHQQQPYPLQPDEQHSQPNELQYTEHNALHHSQLDQQQINSEPQYDIQPGPQGEYSHTYQDAYVQQQRYSNQHTHDQHSQSYEHQHYDASSQYDPNGNHGEGQTLEHGYYHSVAREQSGQYSYPVRGQDLSFDYRQAAEDDDDQSGQRDYQPFSSHHRNAPYPRSLSQYSQREHGRLGSDRERLYPPRREWDDHRPPHHQKWDDNRYNRREQSNRLPTRPGYGSPASDSSSDSIQSPIKRDRVGHLSDPRLGSDVRKSPQSSYKTSNELSDPRKKQRDAKEKNTESEEKHYTKSAKYAKISSAVVSRRPAMLKASNISKVAKVKSSGPQIIKPHFASSSPPTDKVSDKGDMSKAPVKLPQATTAKKALASFKIPKHKSSKIDSELTVSQSVVKIPALDIPQKTKDEHSTEGLACNATTIHTSTKKDTAASQSCKSTKPTQGKEAKTTKKSTKVLPNSAPTKVLSNLDASTLQALTTIVQQTLKMAANKGMPVAKSITSEMAQLIETTMSGKMQNTSTLTTVTSTTTASSNSTISSTTTTSSISSTIIDSPTPAVSTDSPTPAISSTTTASSTTTVSSSATVSSSTTASSTKPTLSITTIPSSTTAMTITGQMSSLTPQVLKVLQNKTEVQAPTASVASTTAPQKQLASPLISCAEVSRSTPVKVISLSAPKADQATGISGKQQRSAINNGAKKLDSSPSVTVTSILPKAGATHQTDTNASGTKSHPRKTPGLVLATVLSGISYLVDNSVVVRKATPTPREGDRSSKTSGKKTDMKDDAQAESKKASTTWKSLPGLEYFNADLMFKEYNLRQNGGTASRADGPPLKRLKESVGVKDHCSSCESSKPSKRERSQESEISPANKRVKLDVINGSQENEDVCKSSTTCDELSGGNQPLQSILSENVTKHTIHDKKSRSKVSLRRKASVQRRKSQSHKRPRLGGMEAVMSEEGTSEDLLCAFCHQRDGARSLGFLYGPYKFNPISINGHPSDAGKDSTRNDSKELWVHEDCAVWAPGVCLVGGQLIGLQEAVADGNNMVCQACRKTGATLCCTARGCKSTYHYPCAQETGCAMKEEQFLISCSKHRGTTQS